MHLYEKTINEVLNINDQCSVRLDVGQGEEFPEK